MRVWREMARARGERGTAEEMPCCSQVGNVQLSQSRHRKRGTVVLARNSRAGIA